MHMVSGTLDGRIRYAKDASENKKKNYFNNIESHYARALDELREATLFVMACSGAKRARRLSMRWLRRALMREQGGRGGGERVGDEIAAQHGHMLRAEGDGDGSECASLTLADDAHHRLFAHRAHDRARAPEPDNVGAADARPATRTAGGAAVRARGPARGLWLTHSRVWRVGGEACPSPQKQKKKPKSKLKTCSGLLLAANNSCQIIDSDIGRVAILVTFSQTFFTNCRLQSR